MELFEAQIGTNWDTYPTMLSRNEFSQISATREVTAEEWPYYMQKYKKNR